mmetsp:Transcript_13988/g.16093  ORF Transcript_13988/g.16093 Transcript_13988/m.16093 type:complete len:346 (+) Transcript_13988:154-1191(+)
MWRMLQPFYTIMLLFFLQRFSRAFPNSMLAKRRMPIRNILATAITNKREAIDTVTQPLSWSFSSSRCFLSSEPGVSGEYAAVPGASKSSSNNNEHSASVERPQTVAEYRDRLVRYDKELYKDPPVLPPADIFVESEIAPLPTRHKTTGALTFLSGKNDNDKTHEALLKDFHPNQTPEEILRAGSFGGTYFRPIVSAVTNQSYNSKQVLKDTVDQEWIADLSLDWLTSKTYRKNINKYKVKSGGSLGMWESSGWIVHVDPYGWFQWYCRFYQGRRCSDDARQISRWLKSAGPKGRFRSQLCNKILKASTTHDDVKISPVIRQTMLHWGLDITPDVLEQHAKRVEKK